MKDSGPLAPGEVVLDCLGLSCPVPMMEAAKRIRELRDGQILLLLADDPAVIDDMAAWCHLTGHEYMGTVQVGTAWRTRVRKRQPPGTAAGVDRCLLAEGVCATGEGEAE